MVEQVESQTGIINETSVSGIIEFLMGGIISGEFKRIIDKEIKDKSKAELKVIYSALKKNKSDSHVKYVLSVIEPLIVFDKELIRTELKSDNKKSKLDYKSFGIKIDSEESITISYTKSGGFTKDEQKSQLKAIKSFPIVKQEGYSVNSLSLVLDTMGFTLTK